MEAGTSDRCFGGSTCNVRALYRDLRRLEFVCSCSWPLARRATTPRRRTHRRQTRRPQRRPIPLRRRTRSRTTWASESVYPTVGSSPSHTFRRRIRRAGCLPPARESNTSPSTSRCRTKGPRVTALMRRKSSSWSTVCTSSILRLPCPASRMALMAPTRPAPHAQVSWSSRSPLLKISGWSYTGRQLGPKCRISGWCHRVRRAARPIPDGRKRRQVTKIGEHVIKIGKYAHNETRTSLTSGPNRRSPVGQSQRCTGFRHFP
jgi:hypothetical protein